MGEAGRLDISESAPGVPSQLSGSTMRTVLAIVIVLVVAAIVAKILRDTFPRM